MLGSIDTAATALRGVATRASARVHGPFPDGRLPRSRDAHQLDHLERVLRDGAIDRSNPVRVGEGLNGPLFRVPIADPIDPAAPPLVAVEKSASAQAPQEEFAWLLARDLGIDHLVPAAARRADGTARIEFRSGSGLGQAGITDMDSLERRLAESYLEDGALALDATQAAHAARFDRQLVQVFDYLIANNDRAANALYDAATGQLSLIDAGHAGRGQLPANGGSVLEPVLRPFSGDRHGGRVSIDRDVLDHVARHIEPDGIRAQHRRVFEAPGMPDPEPWSYGEKFLPHVRGESFREGIVGRLQHLQERGGFTYRPYTHDAAGHLPKQASDNPAVAGFRGLRAHLHEPF